MKKKTFSKLQKLACALYTLGNTKNAAKFLGPERSFLKYCSYLGFKIHQKSQNYFSDNNSELHYDSEYINLSNFNDIRFEDIYNNIRKIFTDINALLHSNSFIPRSVKMLLSKACFKYSNFKHSLNGSIQYRHSFTRKFLSKQISSSHAGEGS